MKLKVILGDQLSHFLVEEGEEVLMMEVRSEATYVPHHPKKIAFLFTAMRHFAKELQERGCRVHYIIYNSPESKGSFRKTLDAFLEGKGYEEVAVIHPGEWRVLEEFKGYTVLEDPRFFCPPDEFAEWAAGKKELLMEFFYRKMRKETGYLMRAGKPEGGEWNYDKENRKPLKTKLTFPEPLFFKPDRITQEVLDLVRKEFPDNFGDLEPFWFAVTAEEARKALRHFIKEILPHFGPFQDAMLWEEYYLYHSALSHYINCGLLLPEEVCDAAEEAYKLGNVPLNSAEGFIRQILGWREYIRGIYWLHMPDYKELNFFEAKNPLPDFYWTGKTKMRCMEHAITQTKKEALSHHIQRLMVTGNFALLAGVDPKEVCAWYLAVYADAYEWVELPNTLGMALFGDGGIVGSKPYAASGSYIDRMSNFCGECHYKVKEKVGESACPFNYLYWDFMLRNEKKLRTNHRLAFAFKTLDNMDEERKAAIKKSAQIFLSKIAV